MARSEISLPLPGPPQELYIYYLAGHAGGAEETFGSDFVGNWHEDDFSFLFFARPSGGIVRSLLDARPGLRLLDEFHMTYDEWQGGPFIPFEVGKFRILPPWDPGADIHCIQSSDTILLDPGLVFGNGSHPTTRNCLAALELALGEGVPATVMDIGTGTGLLALAAAKLGCPRVLAVDINRLAVRTASRNIRLNRLADRILAVQGAAENFVDWAADVVIANIHYDVMHRLIESEGFLNEKKWLILSGLLRSEARRISERLSGLPVIILKKWEYDAIWHTFLIKSALTP